MKKKKSKLKYIIIAITIIAIIFFINSKKSEATEESGTEYSETQVIKTDIYNTLSSSSYVVTGLEEQKELHATYYFEEIYVKENQKVLAGENIIKYTNGTYMVAPYDCVVTEISVPEADAVCTNKHYITIQSTNTLEMTMNVTEDELDTVYLGQEARIEIDVYDDKELIGYVTDISNTATYSSSGSRFEITIGFENDGEILLGMSAKCSVVLEKAEDVLAVAKEAVVEDKNRTYVIILDENGNQTEKDIEIGIDNDAYIEVKGGLLEGQTVLIIEDEEDGIMSNMKNMINPMMNGGEGFTGNRGNIPSGMPDFSEMPSGGGGMPSNGGSRMPSR